jgi:enoyl-CoA hydratase
MTSLAPNSFPTLSFERKGRVMWVLLNRPKLNLIEDELHDDLSRVFYDLNTDPDVDVIVLTATGKTFCGGGDAHWMQSMIDRPEKFRHVAAAAKRIVFSLLELEKPIICCLQGAAAGLGATIALLCDIIVASDDAVIGDPHVKMGFVAGDGGAVIWPQLIGYARAKEFLLTGEMIGAKRAEQLGLVNYALPSHEVGAKTQELADRLASGATLAIRWTKVVSNIPLRRLAHELMDASIAYEMNSNLTSDHQEAVRAFIEKRQPKFVGS